MKWRNAARKIIHYFRHDFREIAWPSSLPDPPSLATKRRKLTFQDHVEVFRRAGRDYVASWRGPIQDPRFPQAEEAKGETGHKRERREAEPSLLEDLAVAARTGAKGMRPVLQRIFLARAAAYRDAVKEFVVGYQEGLAEGAAGEQLLQGDSSKAGGGQGKGPPSNRE